LVYCLGNISSKCPTGNEKRIKKFSKNRRGLVSMANRKSCLESFDKKRSVKLPKGGWERETQSERRLPSTRIGGGDQKLGGRKICKSARKVRKSENWWNHLGTHHPTRADQIAKKLKQKTDGNKKGGDVVKKTTTGCEVK